MSRIRRLGRNYQFLAVSRIINIIVYFILFPLIVLHVGKELYGVYLLGVTINGYFSTFDLGVGSAVKKYVPEYIGRKDSKGLRSVINASFSFFVIFGLVAAGILYFLSFLGPTLFKVTPANETIMRNLFLVFAAVAVFHWPLQTFRGVVQGLQRYDWLAGLNTVVQIGYLIGTYFLLIRGFGIVSIAILFQSLVLSADFVFFLVSHSHIKGLKLRFPCLRQEILKEIFSFSIYVFLASIAGIVILSIDDLVISVFVSVAAVTIYKVAFIMQTMIRTINSMLGSPLMTLCAEMEGAGEYEKQQQLLLKGTRYMTLLVLPVIAIAIIFSERFILIWMGPEFREAILPAQILLFFWLFNITLEVGTASLTAKGIVRPILWILIIVAVCNLSLSLILVRFLGILGVALGTTISMVLINFPLTLYFVSKKIKVKLVELFNFSIKGSLLVSLLSAVLSMVVIRCFQSTNIFGVILQMFCIYSVVMLCNYLFILSSTERAEIKKMLVPKGQDKFQV